VSPAGTKRPGESHRDSPGFRPGTLEGLAPARAWGFEGPPSAPVTNQHKSNTYGDSLVRVVVRLEIALQEVL